MIVVCALDRRRHPLWHRGRPIAARGTYYRSRPWPGSVAIAMAEGLRNVGCRVWLEAPGAPATTRAETTR